MTAKIFRVVAAAVLAVLLAGCASGPTKRPTQPVEPSPGPPVPVLDIGDPFVVDLLGDGQATVTLVATEVSTAAGNLLAGRTQAPSGTTTAPTGTAAAPDPDSVRLVVTIEMVLDRAGDPVNAGPANFQFRDIAAQFHRARTDSKSYPPELPTVVMAKTGQRSFGKVVFDVERRLMNGGQIQLMAGRLVLAIWRVHQ